MRGMVSNEQLFPQYAIPCILLYHSLCTRVYFCLILLALRFINALMLLNAASKFCMQHCLNMEHIIFLLVCNFNSYITSISLVLISVSSLVLSRTGCVKLISGSILLLLLICMWLIAYWPKSYIIMFLNRQHDHILKQTNNTETENREKLIKASYLGKSFTSWY